MPVDLDILILAAGRGTRMPGDRPKVLHPLFGEPLVRHVLRAGRSLKPREAGVIVGYGAAEVRAELSGEDVTFCRQRTQLGTGHALKATARAFGGRDGHVLVLSGDVPLIRPETLKSLVSTHRRKKAAVTILTAMPKEAGSLGRIIRDGRGRLSAIVEARDASSEELAVAEINAGIYVFRNRDLYDGLKKIRKHAGSGEFYLTDVVKDLVEQGERVATVCLEDPSDAHGINTYDELIDAHETLRRRILAEHAARGVTFVDPSQTHVAPGVSIGPGTVVGPFSVLGAGVSIGARCRIGPFVHLRSNTVVGDDVRLGNFVEVKTSVIGDGSAAAHLAYLGDATIGRDVNVGAGTITANWDGDAHHRTSVGDGARLGSGTILVGPTQVGTGARTGAQTVVLPGRPVEKDETVVGVPARAVQKKTKRKKRRGK